MEHTKGIWEVKEAKFNDGSKVLMIQNQEHYVAEMQESYYPEEPPEYAYKVAEANARRIVLCCNTHDALVEALTILRGKWSFDTVAHRLSLNGVEVQKVDELLKALAAAKKEG